MIFLKTTDPKDIDALRQRLQDAVSLERATILPCLTAMFTLAQEAPARLREQPAARHRRPRDAAHADRCQHFQRDRRGAGDARANFVPRYPGPLPECIGFEDPPIDKRPHGWFRALFAADADHRPSPPGLDRCRDRPGAIGLIVSQGEGVKKALNYANEPAHYTGL